MNENVNSHDIKLIDRNVLSITGAKKILKFDKTQFIVDTIKGILTINGDNLDLVLMNTQDMNLRIKGIINAINYTQTTKKEESFIAKLFK